MLRVGATESESKLSVIEVVLKNIGANKLYLLVAVILAVAIAIYGIWKNRQVDLKNVNISVFLCAVLPFAWYVVVSNHSFVHYWFTYRILAISVYAMLLIAISVFIKEDKRIGK